MMGSMFLLEGTACAKALKDSAAQSLDRNQTSVMSSGWVGGQGKAGGRRSVGAGSCRDMRLTLSRQGRDLRRDKVWSELHLRVS